MKTHRKTASARAVRPVATWGQRLSDLLRGRDPAWRITSGREPGQRATRPGGFGLLVRPH